MRIKLTNGRIYDPSQNWCGEVRNLTIEDGRITDDQGDDFPPDLEYDVSGKIVMPGAIDIHSHIAGGNVNTSRVLLPEQHRSFMASKLGPRTAPRWSTVETGYRYARMGYTTVVEPAVLPANALDAHLQMSDIPIIDTAGLAILGSDDYLLRLIRGGASQGQVNDYVAWSLQATRCFGIKVISAGGANAFKSNARQFGLDDEVPNYEITSRRILEILQRAVVDLRVPHPIHVHCNNLGVPGNVETAVATMEAAQGLPMHLAHIQFYGYGSDGARGFSSATARLLDGFRRHPNITMDVGQVLFGQTVTVSGDVIAQFDRRGDANPNKWLTWEAECEGGGGIVPYRYRESSFVNSLQWAIGLEIFLLADDPSRVFFTTDHPNGAPFTRYPELFRLLMDYPYRLECLHRIHPDVAQLTLLKNLKKEFTLHDIAVMTRSAAAKLLGLDDRGHFQKGALADVAVYTELEDKSAMFGSADLVFKNGELVVKDGEIIKHTYGKTQTVHPHFDHQIQSHIRSYYSQYYSLSMDHFVISEPQLGEVPRFNCQMRT